MPNAKPTTADASMTFSASWRFADFTNLPLDPVSYRISDPISLSSLRRFAFFQIKELFMPGGGPPPPPKTPRPPPGYQRKKTPPPLSNPPTLSRAREQAIFGHRRILRSKPAQTYIIVRMERGASSGTRARACATIILLACCPCASALNPSLDINQYAHTAWTVREGFFKRSSIAVNCSDARRLSLARHGIRLASLRWRSECPMAAASR